MKFPTPPPFGHAMRKTHFQFAPTYKPLNHGSFGTHPTPVRDAHYSLQTQAIQRPDTFISYTTYSLLAKSRSFLAPFLGVHADEVVLIPNATTGVNTVLRNIKFEMNDVVLTFSTVYPACEKTVASIGEIVPVECEKVELVYPVEDDVILALFREKVGRLREEGKNVRLALFDTVLTFPGARFPWEEVVGVCRELGIWSLVDGAHGIGMIDLTHVGKVNPDFFVTNCHKWLYTPRSCAVFHVPFRNQHLIRTSIPTSHGYQYANQPPEDTGGRTAFIYLFDYVATIDYTPYLCIPAALEFRSKVCGGEAKIREYCYEIAVKGAQCMANILCTSVMSTQSGTMRQCAFANVELPLVFKSKEEVDRSKGELDADEAVRVGAWIKKTAAMELDAYLQTAFHAGKLWVRVSGQIYLELEDFRWVAPRLRLLCERARSGEAKGEVVAERDEVVT
ncbi:aminotransferase family protein-like protein [Sporormia fimetaria CBS 119925]|uniref:Aminotransferase family protein-like protein n=1 Tax=Sporormia fimetaria CBS 119925 TaxID=1340428 RepID=A0A6A6V643_9PLEO|nr:aminotransferase family protein-like protein [Sporormia fimetaria CBS 119925]